MYTRVLSTPQSHILAKASHEHSPLFFKDVKLVSGGSLGLNQSKEAAVMLSLWSQSHHPLFIDTELTLEPSLCLPRGTILVMVARCV